MECSYAVSTLEATAVSMSVVCHLKASLSGAKDTNLILAKGNLLEVYSFSELGLVKVFTTSVFGRITALDKYQPGDHAYDALFILTERKHFCILSYDENNNTLITRAKGNLKDQVGRSLEQGQRGALDPEGRMIGMMLYEGLLKVLPIEPNGGLKEAFNVRIEELRHIDFNFLYGYPRPTLCLLYEDNRGSRHLVTHSIDLRERELVEGPWTQTNVEFGARILVPVPLKYGGGVVLIGQSTITYLSHPVNRPDSQTRNLNPGSNPGTVFQTSVGISRTHITSYCLIESDDENLCRFLLGDQFGNLSILLIQKSGASPALFVEPLGMTSISETLSHLGNGVIFVGSCFGDSQLIKLHSDPPSPDSESVIEELGRYPNIGPILDLCFLRNGNVGQVITCSGGYKDGSLRVIKSGIGMTEQASIDVQGIKGLWNLLITKESRSESYLVQSYAWETRALILGATGEPGEEVSELEEIEICGFDHSSPTLFCGNMAKNFVIQVSPSCVRLVNTSTWSVAQKFECSPDLTSNPHGKIFQATGNEMQVALAISDGEVILLEFDLDQEQLIVINRLAFDQDIACLCLRSQHISVGHGNVTVPYEKVNLLVVGLWTDHSVRLHALPSLEEVGRVVLGGEETAQARNVILAPLSASGDRNDFVESKEDMILPQNSGHLHLLVGLGDGTLVTYLLSFPASGLPTISNKQEIRLGTHPVSLSCFSNKGTLCVFAGCDQPTVLFSRQSNDQLLYSPVNIGSEDITSVAPFYHPSFTDCLALASESSLLLGNFDSLQRVHITSYPLGEAPRHITRHETTSTLAVCTSRVEQTQRGEECFERVLFLDQSALTIEASYDLEIYEAGLSICSSFLRDSSRDSDLREYVVVGTAFVLPEEQQPSRGRLLVFELITDPHTGGRIVTLVVETPTRGAAFSLASLNGKLVAGIDSKIQIYRFAMSGEDGSGSPEMILECGHHGHILALYIKTSDDLILVGDLLRSICVLRYRERDSMIEEIARDFNSNLMRSVEIWNENHYIGAEDHGNLFIMRIPQNSKYEEERSRLEVLSGYHIGDFVNVITKGSLSRTAVLEGNTGMEHSSNTLSDSLLLGTVSGRLCSMFPLSSDDFNFLTVLERCLLQVVKPLSVGGLSHEEWRSFFHERRGRHQGYERKTIDGDLIERFLDLTEPMMELVTKAVNDELLYLSRQSEESSVEDINKSPFVPVTLRDLVQRVEDLTRMH